MSYSNFELYPLKEDRAYTTIASREEEETIANRDEEKPKVVLKRSWWVTVRTASAHLLPIAITVSIGCQHKATFERAASHTLREIWNSSRCEAPCKQGHRRVGGLRTDRD
jgi:hypothetical protein